MRPTRDRGTGLRSCAGRLQVVNIELATYLRVFTAFITMFK